MSYDLVQTLQNLDDSELFKICFEKMIYRNNDNTYSFGDYDNGNNNQRFNNKFKEMLMFFQELDLKTDEGRISLHKYARVMPFYIELATRINKSRKYTSQSSRGFNRSPKSIYNYPAKNGFQLINHRVEYHNDMSEYLKMRLNLVVSYKTLSGRWLFKNKDEYIKKKIKVIEEKDDEVLDIARKVLQTLNALTRNLNDKYYDIY
jgi:hypothetical protein